MSSLSRRSGRSSSGRTCARSPDAPEPTRLRSPNRSETLLADLESAITGGAFRRGERIAPIRKLAASYGTSAKAVHSALRRLAEMGLIEMRQGSGTYVSYRPESEDAARTLEAAESVALFISDRAHLFDRLSADLVAELQRSGFRSLKFSRDEGAGAGQLAPGSAGARLKAGQFERQFTDWLERPPRAVVLQWATPGDGLDEAIRRAVGGRSRVITTFRAAVHDWHSVDPDYERTAYIAARHLIERGHKRIGLMTHGCQASKEPISRSHECGMGHMPAIRGFFRAVEEAGVRDGFTMLWDTRPPGEGSGFHHAGTLANVARWLSGPERPTAVVGDDYRLVTVIKAAEQMGLRVPGDLDLVGIGNTPWAEAFGFTSVSLREDLAARHIAEIVGLDADSLGEATRHLVVQPQLVLRGSAPEKADVRPHLLRRH